jgi:flagellar biosynthesis/type III secretory pathway M-ring protein FliF/YscJ
MDAGAGATRLAESAQYLTAWLAAIVGVLTLMLIVAGFFSFGYIRREAQREARAAARDEATKIREAALTEARQCAQAAIDEYVDRALAERIDEYREFRAWYETPKDDREVVENVDDRDDNT